MIFYDINGISCKENNFVRPGKVTDQDVEFLIFFAFWQLHVIFTHTSQLNFLNFNSAKYK